MRRALALVAGAAVGLAALALGLAPARRAALDGEGPLPPRGALHVHTDRSDGAGTPARVAAAAAAAGLDFVILTDHGDATRVPDPPAYLAGVLVIDAVEVSSEGGHVVALGLAAAPYPLAGEARDVVEDVRRLGGMAVAAHPGSPRGELRWSDWTQPVDGIEWLNADSAWRDEPWASLARALLTYPVRPTEALAALLDRPVGVLDRWDARTAAGERLVALPAVDAHGRIGVRDRGPRIAVTGVPSYASTFGLVSMGLPGVTLGGDAAQDAAAVLGAIRAGHVFSVVDGVATPGVLRFFAEDGSGRAEAGDALEPAGAVTFTVEARGPSAARIDLLRDGRVVASGPPPALVFTDPEPGGAYRAEVSFPGAPGTPPVPWMVSNPIYLAPPASPGPAPAVAGTAPAVDSPSWAVETSPIAEGAIDPATAPDGRPEVLLCFALSGRASEAPFVAAAVPVGEGALAGEDAALAFSIRADRAMRVDVQVRAAAPAPGPDGLPPAPAARWHRSIYVEPGPRALVVPLADMRPRGDAPAVTPPAGAIESVLFVVDTVNTPAGASGRVWVSDLRFGRVAR